MCDFRGGVTGILEEAGIVGRGGKCCPKALATLRLSRRIVVELVMILSGRHFTQLPERLHRNIEWPQSRPADSCNLG
jgi:hypothetical protein